MGTWRRDGISAASPASVNPLTCRFDRSVMQSIGGSWKPPAARHFPPHYQDAGGGASMAIGDGHHDRIGAKEAAT
jgi:hypothetical protein